MTNTITINTSELTLVDYHQKKIIENITQENIFKQRKNNDEWYIQDSFIVELSWNTLFSLSTLFTVEIEFESIKLTDL
jgi:hypothetical protein